jgi:hypothetical protein
VAGVDELEQPGPVLPDGAVEDGRRVLRLPPWSGKVWIVTGVSSAPVRKCDVLLGELQIRDDR